MPGASPKLSHQLGFSQRNGTSTLSLAYEDPVQNGPATHRQLIDFLGINAYYAKVAPMYFQPAAIACYE